MAQRRPTAQLTHDDAETAEFIDADAIPVAPDAQDDADAELSDVMTGLDINDTDVEITISVYREQKGGKPAYAGTYTAADLQEMPIMDLITRDHGGGTYRVRVYQDHGRGKRLMRNRLVNVLASARRRVEALPIAATDNGAVMAAINAMTKLVEEREKAPKSDIVEIMAKLAPLAPVAVAIIQAFKPANAADMMEQSFRMMTQLKELSGGAGSDTEKSWFQVAGEALPAILESMKPGGQAPPANAPKQLAPPRQPTPEQIQQAQQAQLKTQLRFLCDRAANNSPPALYAEMVLDMMPPAVVQILVAPGAIDYLAIVEPDILRFRQWFEIMLRAVADPSFDPEMESDVDEPAQSVQDATPHAHSTNAAPLNVIVAPAGQGWHSNDADGNGDESAEGQD